MTARGVGASAKRQAGPRLLHGAPPVFRTTNAPVRARGTARRRWATADQATVRFCPTSSCRPDAWYYATWFISSSLQLPFMVELAGRWAVPGSREDNSATGVPNRAGTHAAGRLH